MVPDAIRLACAVEPLHVLWLEDMITGDYTPYVIVDLYRKVTGSTFTMGPLSAVCMVVPKSNWAASLKEAAQPH